MESLLHNMWQDFVILIGSLVFLIALLPSIFSKNKPDKLTSISTAIVLYVYFGTYITLDLYFSSTVVLATATAWLVLFFQAIKK